MRVELSSEVASAARRQTEEKEWPVVPTFDDMEELTVDATKVTEDKEEEAKPSWADVAGEETM